MLLDDESLNLNLWHRLFLFAATMRLPPRSHSAHRWYHSVIDVLMLVLLDSKGEPGQPRCTRGLDRSTSFSQNSIWQRQLKALLNSSCLNVSVSPFYCMCASYLCLWTLLTGGRGEMGGGVSRVMFVGEWAVGVEEGPGHRKSSADMTNLLILYFIHFYQNCVDNNFNFPWHIKRFCYLIICYYFLLLPMMFYVPTDKI